MPRLALVLILVLLIASSAFAAIAKNLDPNGAYSLMRQRGDVSLLDVRTFDEYQQARLEGARLIPIDQLARRINEVPKDRPVLVYCAVGSRSAQVVNYLARNGYPEVYNLYGGIYAWANRGLPILQGRP